MFIYSVVLCVASIQVTSKLKACMIILMLYINFALQMCTEQYAMIYTITIMCKLTMSIDHAPDTVVSPCCSRSIVYSIYNLLCIHLVITVIYGTHGNEAIRFPQCKPSDEIVQINLFFTYNILILNFTIKKRTQDSSYVKVSQ